MSYQQSFINKIKSQQHTSQHNDLNQNLQQIKLFIQNTHDPLPQLTAEINNKSKIANIVKNYFTNHNDIMFFKDYKAPQSYLTQKFYQDKIESIFSQFIKIHPQLSPKDIQTKQPQHHQQLNSNINNQNQTLANQQKIHKQTKVYPNINFTQFLQFWLEHEPSIHVFYQKYYDALKKSVLNFQDNLYGTVSKNASKHNSVKQIKQNLQKQKQTKPLTKQTKAQDLKQSKSIERQIKKPLKQDKNLQKLIKSPIKQIKKSDKSIKKSIKSLQDQQENNKYQEQNDLMNSNDEDNVIQKVQKKVKNSKVQKRASTQKQSRLISQKQKQKLNKQNKQNQDQIFSQNQQSASRTSTHSQSIPQNTLLVQPKDNFNYYLRKFYDHYCKKYVNTIKNQQFQKLQQFYNSMNLTKFMMYCKDLKLVKLNKKITAKYLQQSFKSGQNVKHCLQYQHFSKIIKQCLDNAFQQAEELQTKGYQHIGVFNRQNFAQVMGRLGVIVPLKKIIFAKAEDVRSLSRMVKSRTKQDIGNLKQSKVMKQGHLIGNQGLGHGHQSNWDSNKLHPDLFLNQKQRKQQRLLQCLTIPKLNKLQPSKHMDQKLQQFVDEEYDPYLRRYNEKNNKSVHQNANGQGHGMMKRIDERIQNVVKKIR